MIRSYIAVYIIDIVALLFLSWMLYSNGVLDSSRKKYFLYGIIFTIIIILSEIGTVFASAEGVPLRIFNILCNVVGFSLTPIIPIILIAIFGVEFLKNNKLFLLPTVLNIIATILSPFFGFIFYVDINNQYKRGTFFFIFITVYIINVTLLIFMTRHIGKKYFYPIKRKMLILSFLTLAGTSIQVFVPEIYLSWHCVTLSLLLFYIILSEFDASFDTLTILNNRVAFEKASTQLTDKKMYAVIAMDINNFKGVNDTYGHDYGDIVLKEMANIIKNSFDNKSTSYRIGGDEFYIISKDTDCEKIEKQIQSVINSLANKRINDIAMPSIAYGYSIFEGGKTLNFREALKDADYQMYCCKRLQKTEESVLSDIK